MSQDYTYCVDCQHVHADSIKRHPAKWLCTKFPRMDGFGFVTPEAWDKFDPFMNCHGINGGACPLFEMKRDEGAKDENK